PATPLPLASYSAAMDERLFDTETAHPGAPASDAPLAVRMRPRSLGELVGQEHVLGEGSALRVAIESGNPHSAILYGPPGAGKTTLARIAATSAEGAFEEESAVNAGRAEIRAVIARAEERRRSSGRHTVLFLDEIHRFNKAQQDALLPAVEEGLLTLIGATTENPYFEVNSALLSRCQIYELRPLDPERVEELLQRALSDPERGLADPPPVAADALEMLAKRSGGDARVALLGLERAVERAEGKPVDVAAVEDALQRKAVDFDRKGDRHYDFISAWIKATRGSDVDASLYYLAVMLEGGEDPRFIARRMVILASEDIGNADPQALLIADAAARAVDRVGLPECAHNLAQAAVYLALAPKSNASYRALGEARAEVRQHGAKTPPDYLRDAHYPGAKALGRGRGYRYAHDEPGGVADQPLLPEGLEKARFYEPTDRGFEAELGRRLQALRKRFRGD
ncbi:MAG TPA: replication-associated recombination protein A, partial [Solirubrobacterales bacterium]|nr:replication-associated recombination protein A [Solirubrobacterales bacterium]